MAEWLEQVFQWHEMYCYDQEVMSSNPDQVELGVHSTSVWSSTWTKYLSHFTITFFMEHVPFCIKWLDASNYK